MFAWIAARKSYFTTAFAATHVLFMTIHCLPFNVRPKGLADGIAAFRDAVSAPYVETLGLVHDWSLFAPEPDKYAYALEVVVRYEDGTSASWFYPRTIDKGYVALFASTRMIGWTEGIFVEVCLGELDEDDEGTYLAEIWRDNARFAVRALGEHGTPAATATLQCHVGLVGPPGDGDLDKVLPRTTSWPLTEHDDVIAYDFAHDTTTVFPSDDDDDE